MQELKGIVLIAQVVWPRLLVFVPNDVREFTGGKLRRRYEIEQCAYVLEIALFPRGLPQAKKIPGRDHGVIRYLAAWLIKVIDDLPHCVALKSDAIHHELVSTHRSLEKVLSPFTLVGGQQRHAAPNPFQGGNQML